MEYIVAIAPDGEPIRFSPGDEPKLLADGYAILPVATDYEAELRQWEKKLEGY